MILVVGEFRVGNVNHLIKTSCANCSSLGEKYINVLLENISFKNVNFQRNVG